MGRVHPPQTPGALDDPAFVRHLLQHLLLTRAVEERSVLNARKGLQPKFFSAWGNEATSVGTAAALQPDDVLVPMHRSLGAHLVRGHSPYDVFLQGFLRDASHTRGRDTGLHMGRPGTNVVGMISPLGSMNAVAGGVAWAERYLRRDVVSLACIGDGGTSLGIFHEALNFVGVHRLPVVTVIENNQWAYGTPTSQQFACETLASRGAAYGMPGVRVDGTDLVAVYEVARVAVEPARGGGGPTLIEAVTMRMRGHAEHDDSSYVPREMLAEWSGKDPVDRFVAWVRTSGLLPDLDVAALKAEIDAQVLEAADRAQAAPEPAPEVGLVGVFAGDGDAPSWPDNGSTATRAPTPEVVARLATAAAESCRDGSAARAIPEPGATVTYLEAIRECLRHRLRTDGRTILLGEDIGRMGGAFRVTEGLLAEFGASRVIDTPIAEGAIVGASIGMAIRGLLPVAEMQFADFVASCFNELVNNAGTFRWRIGQGVPMVLRLPAAGGLGAGPFHSLDPEAWFAHSPGLKVVVPATVEDAWGLLAAAIDDPDPVIFCEQKALYRSLKGPLPARDFVTPLGKARIARPGSDATVVAWGLAVGRAVEAADRVAAEGGGQVEVIDLRSIVPWDKEAVAASLKRTSRLLVVHEARRTAGFGAEIAAWAAEELFEWLDAPIARLGAADVPSPSHKAMERAATPQAEGIASALASLLSF